jgi:hypothetical protein
MAREGDIEGMKDLMAKLYIRQEIVDSRCQEIIDMTKEQGEKLTFMEGVFGDKYKKASFVAIVLAVM